MVSGCSVVGVQGLWWVVSGGWSVVGGRWVSGGCSVVGGRWSVVGAQWWASRPSPHAPGPRRLSAVSPSVFHGLPCLARPRGSAPSLGRLSSYTTWGVWLERRPRDADFSPTTFSSSSGVLMRTPDPLSQSLFPRLFLEVAVKAPLDLWWV